MSEAPERIWIDKVHGQHPEDWNFTDGKHLTKRQLAGKVEYVRADRIEALIKERDEAEQRGYANAMEAERKLHEDRIEELEAKLAQQDDLVQAAVAAALREAANIARASLDGELGYDDILALITPDAQAALDRYVKERSDELVAAENERLRNALHKIGEHSKMNAYSSAHIICHACSDTHHAVEAAIRKGGEDA